MIERLRKGLFSERKGTGLFGIRHGQEYPDEASSGVNRKLSYEGGWLNAAGELMGHGDLSVADAKRIARGLRANEIFLILPAYWRAVHEELPAIPASCILRYGSWLIQRGKSRRIRGSHHDKRNSAYPVGDEEFDFVEIDEVEALIGKFIETELPEVASEELPQVPSKMHVLVA